MEETSVKKDDGFEESNRMHGMAWWCSMGSGTEPAKCVLVVTLSQSWDAGVVVGCIGLKLSEATELMGCWTRNRLSQEACPECIQGQITRKMLFHWQACPVTVYTQNESPGWYLPAESKLFSPLQPSMDLCLVTCLGWMFVKETMCPGTFWAWAVKQMYMELCFREIPCRWMGCGKIQPACSPTHLLLPSCNLITRVSVYVSNLVSEKVSSCDICSYGWFISMMWTCVFQVLQAELCFRPGLAPFTAPKLSSLHLLLEKNGRYRILFYIVPGWFSSLLLLPIKYL